MVFKQQQNKRIILWELRINQGGVTELGLWGKTDPIDWLIIWYIAHWMRYSRDKRVLEDGTLYVWFSYKYFMEEMPAVSSSGVIKTRRGLEKRIKKLHELGLIDSFLEGNKKLYVALTDKAERVIGFREFPLEQVEQVEEVTTDTDQTKKDKDEDKNVSKTESATAPEKILREVRADVARKQEERQERKLKKRRVTLSLPDRGTDDSRMNEVLATDVIRQIYEKNWERMYPDSGCPLWEAKEIKVVKTLIRKLGSAQRAITLIEYVFDEWENLKRKWNKEGAPTIEIIATYGVGLIGEAEKWQKGRDEFRQIKWEEVQV